MELPGKKLRKTRYIYEVPGGIKMSIDEFHANSKGLP